MNYRLQPVIRSEPHPVFIQPVKELVVKRWKSFRRRFEGSLNGALRSNASEDMSMTSESGPSGVTSPGMSSDARLRRLRAQERGEIHSSVDSTQHYSTPVLSPYESRAASPFLAESLMASPGFRLSDPIASATFMAVGESTIVATPAEIRHRPTTPTLEPLPARVQVPTSLNATPGGQTSNLEELPAFMLPKPILNTPSSSHPYRSRKVKERRKSMLSEMHTPEDFADYGDSAASSHVNVQRNGLNAAGSELTSQLSSPVLEPQVESMRSGSMCEDIGYFEERLNHEGIHRRPRMTRTSSNGTQVFSPGDGGVELDGLPVGPSRHVWDGQGKSRERSYL
jgi:hypothetical protein